MEQRCATQRGVEGGSLAVRARFSAKSKIYMVWEISLKFADKVLALIPTLVVTWCRKEKTP